MKNIDKKRKKSKKSKIEKFFDSRYTILTLILISSFLPILIFGFLEVLTSTSFVFLLVVGDIILTEYFYRKYQNEKT